MWNTLKAIKDEALATAKELRDAHNPEHWTNEGQQDEDEHPYAFQAPANVPLAPPPPLYSSLPPPPITAAPAIPPPTVAAPPPISAQPPPPAAPAPKEDDVTARLAALKAKLAAKTTTAPRTTTSTAPTTTATAAVPPTASAAPLPPAVDATAITNLQHQLEEERRHYAAQLDATRNEAAHQCHALQTALAEAQQRAAEAEERSRAHHNATDEDHERVIASLRAEIQATQEEVMTERSKSAAVAAQTIQLQERIDRAEAAAASVGDHNELENELVAAKMESRALREELERVRSQALTASAAATATNNENVGNIETTAGVEIASLRSELESMKHALATSEAEKTAARQQLSKLKTQMLSEQDDEEEKIKWRVEAEVKLALEKMGKTRGSGNNSGGVLHSNGGGAHSSEELDSMLERVHQLEAEATRWETIAAAKDAELANLQRALGEMSYESDAAERYRAELRAMQAEIHTLRDQLDAARVSSLSAENTVQQAQNEVAAARGDAKIARDAETEAKREVLAARVAAQEALKELQDLRKGGGTIDRTAVVQLIAGVMVQKRPKDALNFAIKAINLSPEEIESVKTTARQTSGSGGGGGGGVSLASSWIDFLESAVQEDGSSTHGNVAPIVLPPPATFNAPKSNHDPFAVTSSSSLAPPLTLATPSANVI